VDSFLPPIALAEKRVTEIEDQVYTARPDDIQAFIREIEESRKSVSSLIRLLSGKNNVLSGFDKHHCVDLSCEDVDTGYSLNLYIGDIQDHLVSMLANLRQFESLLARSQETCIAGFENGVLSRRKRINALMAVLTLMTMIMSLMNIVCSLFSTNINANVPLYANNSPAWFIIVGLEVLAGSFLFWLARRFRWW
jgi:Mg2+ and Co2+ transporter CorA